MAERLIIEDRQQTDPADMCFVVFVPVSTRDEVHVDVGVNLGVNVEQLVH